MSSKIIIDNVSGQITADGSPITGGGAATLDELTDVTLTSPSSGQVLKYNGSAWINDTDAGGAAATESSTISASALTGTTNIDTASTRIHYFTTAATANWTPNFRSTSGATLNSVMAVGDVMTVTILATIGSSGFYSAAAQVDGSSVTLKWAGGIVPTSGNTNGIDAYSYTIIKTASATFTVIASMAQFA
jgi:hypothetical protein